MTRSLYKGPFINFKLFELIKLQKQKKVKKFERVLSRSSYIHPIFLDRWFLVHNGKGFIRVNVQEDMIGHKFGEFSSTRRKDRTKKRFKKQNKR